MLYKWDRSISSQIESTQVYFSAEDIVGRCIKHTETLRTQDSWSPSIAREVLLRLRSRIIGRTSDADIARLDAYIDSLGIGANGVDDL